VVQGINVIPPMMPLADLGKWRDEIEEKVVEKMVDKSIEG